VIAALPESEGPTPLCGSQSGHDSLGRTCEQHRRQARAGRPPVRCTMRVIVNLAGGTVTTSAGQPAKQCPRLNSHLSPYRNC
jgi:hypothetical protein